MIHGEICTSHKTLQRWGLCGVFQTPPWRMTSNHSDSGRVAVLFSRRRDAFCVPVGVNTGIRNPHVCFLSLSFNERTPDRWARAMASEKRTLPSDAQPQRLARCQKWIEGEEGKMETETSFFFFKPGRGRWTLLVLGRELCENYEIGACACQCACDDSLLCHSIPLV